MNKAPSHLSWCDSRSADLARVRLALPKTGSEVAWQCRNRRKTIGADLNHHLLVAGWSGTTATLVPCSAALRQVTIPIAGAAQRLRGLVQHVLSP